MPQIRPIVLISEHFDSMENDAFSRRFGTPMPAPSASRAYTETEKRIRAQLSVAFELVEYHIAYWKKLPRGSRRVAALQETRRLILGLLDAVSCALF